MSFADANFAAATVLRGLGAAVVALPWLEAMGPLIALGAATGEPATHGAEPHGVPLRAQRQEHGRLDADSRRADFELPPILEPLAPFKSDFSSSPA